MKHSHKRGFVHILILCWEVVSLRAIGLFLSTEGVPCNTSGLTASAAYVLEYVP